MMSKHILILVVVSTSLLPELVWANQLEREYIALRTEINRLEVFRMVQSETVLGLTDQRQRFSELRVQLGACQIELNESLFPSSCYRLFASLEKEMIDALDDQIRRATNSQCKSVARDFPRLIPESLDHVPEPCRSIAAKAVARFQYQNGKFIE